MNTEINSKNADFIQWIKDSSIRKQIWLEGLAAGKTTEEIFEENHWPLADIQL